MAFLQKNFELIFEFEFQYLCFRAKCRSENLSKKHLRVGVLRGNMCVSERHAFCEPHKMDFWSNSEGVKFGLAGKRLIGLRKVSHQRGPVHDPGAASKAEFTGFGRFFCMV